MFLKCEMVSRNYHLENIYHFSLLTPFIYLKLSMSAGVVAHASNPSIQEKADDVHEFKTQTDLHGETQSHKIKLKKTRHYQLTFQYPWGKSHRAQPLNEEL